MSASASNMFFSYSSNQIPIFDGEHFEYWSSQMETIFLSQDLWSLVEEGFEDPTEESSSNSDVNNDHSEAEQRLHKENVMKNALALRILQQSVSKIIYPRIFCLKKVNEAWEVLKKEFKGSQKVIAIRLQNLWRDFDNLMMKDTEAVKDYFSRIVEILNQLKSYGEIIPDRKIVEKILRSLPQKFEHVVTVIEETKDLTEFSIYELMGSLEAHEKRVSKYITPIEQAFQAKINITEQKQERRTNCRGRGGKPRGRGRGHQGGRTEGYHRNKSAETETGCRICKKQNHETKDCYFRCKRCRFPNHSERDCRFKDKEPRLEQKQDEGSTINFSKEETLSKVFFSSSVQNMHETWFLDSGCSNHVTRIKENFAELDDNYNSLLELGDSKKLKIEGKGTVSVVMAEDQHKHIQDVFYTPGITQNLLSVGQMMRKGYKLIFAGESREITDKTGQKIAVIKITSNNLFPLKMDTCSNLALKIGITDESQLWHLRYGHLNHKGLALLKQKEMVIGLPLVQATAAEICEG